MGDITTEDELRTLVKRPFAATLDKIETGPLGASAARFVEAARLAFVTMTHDGQRRALVAGGQAGFASVDERGRPCLAVDSGTSPELATAAASESSIGALCEAAAVNGRTPKLGIVIQVSAADLRHDPALAASGIWDPSTHARPDDVPTIGSMVADPADSATLSNRLKATATNKVTGIDYRLNLY